MEHSDPYGSRAWDQRIGKELCYALQFHKNKELGNYGQRARNPITHEEFGCDSIRSESSATSICSSASSVREVREKIQDLENTLHKEHIERRDVEKQFKDLKEICIKRYNINPDTLKLN